MQEALNITAEWCGLNSLSANSDKTKLILFTRRNKKQGLKNIFFYGKSVNQVKYLGIILDHSAKSHESILQMSC